MNSYRPFVLRDLSESLAWRPGAGTLSGRAANSIINDTLHRMDGAFSEHLGRPRVPSLLTYAKHASRTVGSQLARMEATLRLMRYFDLNAAVDLIHDLRARPATKGQAQALLAQFVRAPHRFYHTVAELRRAIAWGNLQAYGSLVPAFGIYLDAESNGEDGVAALGAFGYGSGERDPHGLVLRAFRLYRTSRDLLHLADERRSAIRDDLLAARRRVALAATVALSLHEQMLFQSTECYEHPDVKQVLRRLTPTLAIDDPVDRMLLLPDGGNWAEFADRMGLEETEGHPDLTIEHASGRVVSYRLARRTIVPGTIFDYLTSRLLDPDELEGVSAAPLPLPAYDDGEARACDRLRQSYRRVRGTYAPHGARAS